MHEAAAALASGHVAAVDISEANGHLFTHHVTLGLHPHMVRIRQRFSYRSRYGKIWASVQALGQALRDPPLLQVEVVTGEGDRLRMRTPILVVTNNPLGTGHLPYPDDPSAGVLGIYIGRSRRWTDLLELTAEAVLGDINSNALLEQRFAHSAEIHLRRPRTHTSIDGELVTLSAPIKLQIRHGGLKVLRPKNAESASINI